ncbi:MAG TPA: hypothetical protein VFV44_01030 [Nitrospiraceae bacterium]|jgi:hypothetical protein|nr:hypothetical protein [Nitrospiraceae bacterium]HSV90501.1 hypothetical protein [Nitrospiraceae bacterium]
MYRLEGSWYPFGPLIGGPPGIPGSPCPAEPNLFPTLELVVEPTPGADIDVDPMVAWSDTPALGAACGVCTA